MIQGEETAVIIIQHSAAIVHKADARIVAHYRYALLRGIMMSLALACECVLD